MKLKYISLLFVTALISVLFGSCSDDNSLTTPVNNETFIYPVKDGNYWKYNSTISYSDIKPDSVAKYFSNVYGNAKVSVLYDSVINNITTKCFIEEFTSDTIHRVSRNYYINTDTAFLLFASSGITAGFMPQKDEPHSFFIYERPLKVLLYPVITGRQWKMDTSSAVMKTYLGFENITTQVGIISCMKTVRSHKFNMLEPETIDYYHYYSSKGLVKEHVIINDFEVSVPGHPELYAIADITVEKILTEYHINP